MNRRTVPNIKRRLVKIGLTRTNDKAVKLAEPVKNLAYKRTYRLLCKRFVNIYFAPVVTYLIMIFLNKSFWQYEHIVHAINIKPGCFGGLVFFPAVLTALDRAVHGVER